MSKHTTQHAEDKATLADAKAERLAQEEAEADDYGKRMVEADVDVDVDLKLKKAEKAAPKATTYDEPEPARFSNGGAPFHEIEAWRAEHGA